MPAMIWDETLQAFKEADAPNIWNESAQAFVNAGGKVWNETSQSWKDVFLTDKSFSAQLNISFPGCIYYYINNWGWETISSLVWVTPVANISHTAGSNGISISSTTVEASVDVNTYSASSGSSNKAKIYPRYAVNLNNFIYDDGTTAGGKDFKFDISYYLKIQMYSGSVATSIKTLNGTITVQRISSSITTSWQPDPTTLETQSYAYPNGTVIYLRLWSKISRVSNFQLI